jgi:hypothetical protein
MKNLINKLTFPVAILAVINMIGYVYHVNYDAAVIGSIIGMIVGFAVNEIKVRL